MVSHNITQSTFRQTEEWKLGHSGELLISELLKKNGWFVIPSYDYTGSNDNKAPKLYGTLGCYVIPDLDTAQNGNRRWVEVKTKSSATFTRITRRFEHGIPLRHYRDYLEVQKITGTQVCLFVYEQNTQAILYQMLNELVKYVRIYDGGKMSRGGMAFFPRDKFKILTTPMADTANKFIGTTEFSLS